MELSRRNFVEATAGTIAVGLAATTATSAVANASEADIADTGANVNWDAEYDVIVIGYGMAGAVASITASEAGANVLLIDKAPLDLEGGNSRVACQLILSPAAEDRDEAITYFKNLRGLYTDQSDEIIECLVDGLISNYQWFIDHGATSDDLIVTPMPEYPELEGSDAALSFFYKGSWGSQVYKWLHGMIADITNIDFWSNSPAVELIQDPDSKIILGVIIEHEGEQYNIRAKNGVVMTCGGFENNQAMLQNYAQQPNAYAKGAHYNTGDGIKMAIKVNADLWHLSTLSGPDVNFIDPLSGNAAAYALTQSSKVEYCCAFPTHNVIIVGTDGSRFMNEANYPRHGHISYSGTYRCILVPNNSWCIFDETARLTDKAYYTWSDGMVDEIEKGWIVKADTIEELAELIGIVPDNLAQSVAYWNECCANGVDPVCRRGTEFLNPLETPPYYAFEVRPTNTNTQGGARRNTKCEIVDVDGNPIPHLYSAGEFGSFYADIYNGGGNLGECIFTGQMAGAAAAQIKDDVTQDSLMTSPQTIDFTETRPDYEPENANEHIGVGDGMGGDLVVKVTTNGDTITDIEVLYNHETPDIGTKAFEVIIPEILETQQTVVDVVTGCSLTSRALMNAINDALGTGIVIDAEEDVDKYLSDFAVSWDSD